MVKKELGIGEELDKEDEKSVGRVIKQLKKAVKAHQGQVDTLAKDIKDEVELDEAVSDGQVAQARRMTDKNDHFGARKYLASIIRDKEMMQMYDSLEKMHRMDLGGNDALTLRGKLDKKLEFRLTQKLKKDAKRLLDAL